MADNYTISSVTYRSDDIGDIQHPGVKVMHGADGAAAFASAADPLPVTGTVAVNEAKAEDAASANGDRGIPVLAVRQDTLSSSTSNDGDYGFLKADSSGRLFVRADFVAASDNTTDSVSATIDSSYMMDDHTRIAPTFYSGTITAGTGTMVAAVASKKARVISANFTMSASANFNILNGASGASLIGTRYSLSSLGLQYNPAGHFQTGTNTALIGSVSTGTLSYCLTVLEV